MIGEIASRHLPVSAATRLLRRLLPALIFFAIVEQVTAESSTSFAQSLDVIGVQPASAPIQSPDDRYIVSADDSSYRAIGQLIGPIPCTGTVVLHPRIVLTAADCVIEKGRVTRAVSFRPFHRTGADLDDLEGKVVAVGSIRQLQSQSIYDASQDWAIILLNKRVPGIRPLDVAGYTPVELQSMRHRIQLPGYSRDLAHGQALSVDPSCSIEGIKWDVLVHDCAAGVGALGAPLLVRDSGCYAVVGVHSGSMLVEDHDADDGRMQFAGRSAIGTWNFVDRLRVILRQVIANEGNEDVAMHSRNACSRVIAVSDLRTRSTSL